MNKKIPVGLTIVLILFASVITFQLTIIFGSAFMRSDPIGTVPTEYTDATDAPEDPDPENPGQETTVEEITRRISEKIAALAELYVNYYVGEIDVDELVDGAAQGFVAYTGDKYGAYHDAEEYASITADVAGEFAGIGVSVLYDSVTATLEVLNVLPNSPALDAGLQPNDRIIGVGGVSIGEIGYTEAVNRIRGEIGTDVTITIARGENYETRFDVTLTRRLVEEQSVTCEFLYVDAVYNPIAYIRLTEFNRKTPEQFAAALEKAVSEGAFGYIVDLRNNGGGELNAIVSILDMLLPEGPIVRIQYKDGTEQVATSDKNDFGRSFVLLTNDNTASAAELFVSALLDYDRATTVGENTYGKGTVQSIIPFEDGSALRISTSMYAPPFSDNYEGVGIAPEIPVSLADEYKNVNLFKLAHEDDAQLQAALDLFR